MRSKIVSLLAVAFSLGFAQAASAADMPVKARPAPVPVPVFSWAGCYVGADAGYAWQRDTSTETIAATGALSATQPGATNPHGLKGGGYLGCNYQFAPSWIVGIEGDAEGADVAHSTATYAPSPDYYEARTRFQGSIRGRVGYAFDRSLLYVTGGIAFASITNHYVGLEANGFTTDATSTRTGWTVGGGWEYAFTNNWIGRIEYRYADFGTRTDTLQFCATCAAANEAHRTTENVVRVGIAYKF